MLCFFWPQSCFVHGKKRIFVCNLVANIIEAFVGVDGVHDHVGDGVQGAVVQRQVPTADLSPNRVHALSQLSQANVVSEN